MTDLVLYSEMLEEIFLNYEGKYENLLKKIPLYFNILQKVYCSNELNWEAKFKINSCFSYFAIPIDLIPDDGPEGYLDDLFICTYVLKDIVLNYSYVIKEFSVNLSELNQVLNNLNNLLGEKIFEILRFAGLTKFINMAQTMAFLKTPDNIDEKIERISDEILSLIALVKTIFIVEGKKLKGLKLKHIKKLFSDKEWSEVINILEKLELHENYFDNSHELEMDDIRKKVLLEIDESIFDEK